MSGLVQAFQKEVGATEAAAAVTYDTAEVARFLTSLYDRGRAAHPKLAVGEAAFGRCLARAIAGDGPQTLEQLAAEDLYLACACAEAVRGASGAFESAFGSTIRRAVSRVVAANADRDEAEQRVRAHLLVDERGAGPAIAKYTGRVPLARWIAVVAIRIAISLNRSESTERRLRDKAGAEAIGVSAEHLYMKAELRDAVEPAITDALARLGDRDRLILRLYLVGGLTTRAIGSSLGLSQPAISKRLANVREALLADIRDAVATRLKIPKDELSSLMRFVASQLDISVSRALRT
jgi:RNA polymerase sigma-70 factor (ECF subfamily)